MIEYGESLPALYSLDRTNGWSKGMRAITHALLAQLDLPPGPILEVGCGAGVFNAELAACSPNRVVVGTDLHPLALAYAQDTTQPSSKLVRSDLQQLPFADGTFGACFALDTFDQAGVHVAHALTESWRVLRGRGMLIVRVSAYPWLEGKHDAAFNTGRRFTAGELRHLLCAQGFELLRMTYANSLLAPPIIVLRLLERWGYVETDMSSNVGSPLNALLAQALGWEAQWLHSRNFAYGISLYALAHARK